MSIQLKEMGVFAPGKPVDKHGREMQAGDLFGWRGDGTGITYGPFRMSEDWRRGSTTMASVRSARSSHEWVYDGSTCFEVLARSLPADPVPESFEPERDAEGRPVLGESNICDVCHRGAAVGTLTRGTVRGVAGWACRQCASLAKYPIQETDVELIDRVKRNISSGLGPPRCAYDEILERDTTSGTLMVHADERGRFNGRDLLTLNGIDMSLQQPIGAKQPALCVGSVPFPFDAVAWALAALCRPVAIDMAEAEAFALRCYAEFEKHVRDWLTGTNIVAVFDWGYTPERGDRRPSVELSQPLLGEKKMFFDDANVIGAIQSQVETWCAALAIRAMGKR